MNTTCSTCGQQRRIGKMTASDVVLLAMLQLEKNTGLDHFDHDAIVVQAWKIDSDTFGMRMFPYPDSKRVSMELTKTKSLIQSGLIEKMLEPRRYRLTDSGRTRAKTLNDNAVKFDKPIPFAGKQGFFDVPDELIK